MGSVTRGVERMSATGHGRAHGYATCDAYGTHEQLARVWRRAAGGVQIRVSLSTMVTRWPWLSKVFDQPSQFHPPQTRPKANMQHGIGPQ